ncbi:helix-turn-helix transcriptional regulator [Saccharomonospora sp. NPDC046836]|uniref:helix-turn-helix domain-containing protein n=1 Tax=Saccharomonospora sp. NPDC046836 TaxID=3156921 RepID=UPI0033CB0E3D
MAASSPLSENLARFRKARDLSQEQLAEAATVGVDTVARIEQGKRTTCRPATLARLASALENNRGGDGREPHTAGVGRRGTWVPPGVSPFGPTFVPCPRRLRSSSAIGSSWPR